MVGGRQGLRNTAVHFDDAEDVVFVVGVYQREIAAPLIPAGWETEQSFLSDFQVRACYTVPPL